MRDTTLGMILAGYGKPDRWVVKINDYQPMDGNKAYITETDGSNHIDSMDNIIWFVPSDNIGILGGAYYKIPNSCLTYVSSFH